MSSGFQMLSKEEAIRFTENYIDKGLADISVLIHNACKECKFNVEVPFERGLKEIERTRLSKLGFSVEMGKSSWTIDWRVN